ncbi:MAG: hypothetical protein Q7R94_03255 [bacterium]|nr:hypothetical protein [bacterium]
MPGKCHFCPKEAVLGFNPQYTTEVCLDYYIREYKRGCEMTHNSHWYTLIDLKTGERVEPWLNPDGYRRFFPGFAGLTEKPTEPSGAVVQATQ